MKRSTANVLIDSLAAVCLLAMIGTGYILRYPLPPGTNKELSLWSLSRHQWGDLHFWSALGLLAILLVHLMLHWDWIVSVAIKRLGLAAAPGPGSYRKAGIVAALVLAVVMLLFAFAAHRSVTPSGEACCDEEPAPSPETGPGSSNFVSAEPAVPAATLTFRDDVYPLLRACIACHSGTHAFGNFRVDRKEDYFGVDGRPPLIVPGSGGSSPLYAILSGARAMPHPAAHRLPANQADLVRRWIDQGAQWQEPGQK